MMREKTTGEGTIVVVKLGAHTDPVIIFIIYSLFLKVNCRH